MTGTNGRESRPSHGLSLILRSGSRPFPAPNDPANASSLVEFVLDVRLDGSELGFGTPAAPIPMPAHSAHTTMPWRSSRKASRKSKRRSIGANAPPLSPPPPPFPAPPSTPKRYSTPQRYDPRDESTYEPSVSLHSLHS